MTRQLIFLISAMAFSGHATGSTVAPPSWQLSQTFIQPNNGSALGAAKPAHILPRKDSLSGIAAFAAGNKSLTPDQIRIGYELCGGLGPYRPDCPLKTDRARILELIKQTRDSLDFLDDMNMNTPLTLAALRGDAELVTAIMAKGVSLHMPRPLVAYRQIDMALVRAVSGLTVSVGDTHPSFYGKPEGYVATIKLLLNAGAIPQLKNWPWDEPVDEALWMRTPDAASIKIRNKIVQLLLKHGAVPNTALPPNQLACLKDEFVLNALLAHGLEIRRSQSTEVLVAAVQCQNHAMVKLALDKGADPNVRPAGRQESLITTADEESAKLLLAAGANPNVCWGGPAAGTCGADSVPLIFKFPKDPELLRLMIAKGANPNAEDAQSNTVLGHALEKGMVVCAVFLGRSPQCLDDSPQRAAAAITLLNVGADPNKRSQGLLPLMLVQDSEHEAIALLLDKGAHMQDTTPEGVRLGPVSMAMATQRPFLAGELLRRLHGKIGSNEKWALFAAARDGNIALVEGLAQHGADLDAQAPYGETALHYAAANGNVAMVKRLLELGANPSLQTETSDYFISANKFNLPAILANGVISTFVKRKNMQYLAAGLKPLKLPAGETALDIARGNSQMEQLFAGHK